MTKKDYKVIAEILKKYRIKREIIKGSVGSHTKEDEDFYWLLADFRNMFFKDNENFNEGKFDSAVYSE